MVLADADPGLVAADIVDTTGNGLARCVLGKSCTRAVSG